MDLLATLALGFFLGMRHATDADHVMAVSTIVSRERTLSSAARIGALWGLGHTITIVLVGGAIVTFGLVIQPRVGLGMELSVAIMLVVLGGWTVHGVLRDASAVARARDAKGHVHLTTSETGPDERRVSFLRPLIVGVVHGLAGSAAVALLVLAAIHDALTAVLYLVVFGVGTVAGMMLITTAIAAPIARLTERFDRLKWALGAATGVASIMFGAFLLYQIGFLDGLFTGNPEWSPH